MSAYSDARRAERDDDGRDDRDEDLSGMDRGRQRYRARHSDDAAHRSAGGSGMAAGSDLYQQRRAGRRVTTTRTTDTDEDRDVVDDLDDEDLADDAHVHDGGRRRGTARGGVSMGQGRNPQTGGDAGTGVQAGRDRWSRRRDSDAPPGSQRGRDPREQRAHRKRIEQQVTRSRQNRADPRDD